MGAVNTFTLAASLVISEDGAARPAEAINLTESPSHKTYTEVGVVLAVGASTGVIPVPTTAVLLAFFASAGISVTLVDSAAGTITFSLDGDGQADKEPGDGYMVNQNWQLSPAALVHVASYNATNNIAGDPVSFRAKVVAD